MAVVRSPVRIMFPRLGRSFRRGETRSVRLGSVRRVRRILVGRLLVIRIFPSKNNGIT